jgi:diguanylate cyclase (GGDEF)-like protein/PAS domain S-box-containing protein
MGIETLPLDHAIEDNKLTTGSLAKTAPLYPGIATCKKGGPSHEELLMFFEQSSDLLCVINFDGYFVHTNSVWGELFGYSADKLADSHYLELVHPDDQAASSMESLNLNQESPVISRFQNRFRIRSGGYRWLAWSARSDPDKKLIFASARDITETKESQGHFQVVVEAAPAGLMIANRQGRITLVNRQIETLFGYSREELQDRPVEDLIPERYRRGHSGFLNKFFESPTTRAMGAGRDLFALRKDATEFPVELALNPFHTGDSQYVLCTVVDITERKRQESELNQRVLELQRHRAEMDTLSRMSSLLQHAVDADEVHQIISGFSSHLFEHSAVGIYNLPASGNYLRLTTSWGNYEGPEILRPDDCWALRRSRTHHCSATSVPLCPHVGQRQGGYNICIPMSGHGQLIGLISIAAQLSDQSDEISQLDRLGKSVADQLALALSNLGLRQQLENLSMRDSLTNLYNRRYLEETVPRELERAIRKRGFLSVLMIDADHFKKFNDTHGHQAGDEALRLISRIFKTQTRPSDVACRYGGEEFIILLPECSKEEAAERAEHLRKLVWNESKGSISISTGVAEYPFHGVEWSTLLQAADHALYSAKSSGRNCVVIATSPNDHSGLQLQQFPAAGPDEPQAAQPACFRWEQRTAPPQ